MSRSNVRVVAFAAGLCAVGALVFFGVRTVLAPGPDDEEAEFDDEPAADLPRGEHFERVRAATRDVYDTFPGRIRAKNIRPVGVPAGMRVAVVEIVKDSGDAVKKGDVLLRFNRPAVEKAIEEAEKKGLAEDAARFRTYLEYCDLKSPYDGIVHEVKTELARVPVDAGDTALVTIADASSFALHVVVPSDLTKTVAHLGAKLTAILEGSNGRVAGVVAAYEEAPAGHVGLIVSLEGREGLEEDMIASLRVPVSKVEVALVPKAAVREKNGVKIVRVWETADRMVAERTIDTDGDEGGDWIVTKGVFPEESVVVPDVR